jgi:hypothetical protein
MTYPKHPKWYLSFVPPMKNLGLASSENSGFTTRDKEMKDGWMKK